MKKEIIYSLKGIYREDYQIEGYRFGGGEKSACIVGALRGNEIQQLYICSQLVKALKELEAHGAISHNHEILVIPSVNRFSMNVGKRFWPTDNSDIDEKSARQAVSSVLRFLTRMGILKYNNHSGYIASVINEFDLMAVKTYDAGFYKRLKEPGDPVYHGELIAQILDPCEGTVKSEIISQTDGIVFFAHTGPTVMGNQVVYKIIRRMHE